MAAVAAWRNCLQTCAPDGLPDPAESRKRFPSRQPKCHMNYSAILEELENASLFDLYRLEEAIRCTLEDPARLSQVRSSLRVGQDVHYFDAEQNRLIAASVVELKRKRVVVRRRDDGRLWNIPLYQINLTGEDVSISAYKGKLDRNSLKVGDKVTFKDRKGHELFGQVIKLNQKTAGVLVGTTSWNVSYGLLSPIIEGELSIDALPVQGDLFDHD